MVAFQTGRAGLPTHVTKRTYWEGINAWTRTESQTTSVLKAVTLVSQFRNSASAKPGSGAPFVKTGDFLVVVQCASEEREGA